jgi:uncharacterized membrane protein
MDGMTMQARSAVRQLASNDMLAAGRTIFGLGILGLGLQHLLLTDFPAGLEPVPDWVTGRALWASVVGCLLMITGICIVANRRARLASVALATMLVAGTMLLHLPELIVNPASGGKWVSAFELLALAASALALAALSRREPRLSGRWNALVDRMTVPGIALLGLSSIVFGTVHFLYAQAVAGLIPGWIPGALAWTYAIGAARIAAGLSLVTRVKAQITATLLTLMYGTWVLIVHIPRVVSSVTDASEWTLLVLAVAFCGGACLVAAPRAEPAAAVAEGAESARAK